MAMVQFQAKGQVITPPLSLRPPTKLAREGAEALWSGKQTRVHKGADLDHGLQKHLEPNSATRLKQTDLFKAMLPRIRAGTIMPALRKNQVDFYEGGARLFTFGQGSFKTNGRYLADELPSRDIRPERVGLVDAEKTLHVVRTRGLKHRQKTSGAASELAAVHVLAKSFSAYRDEAALGQLLLIDLEARFAPTDADGTQDMIDMVFLTPAGRVLFVEAKRRWDGRCRSTSVAEVEAQQLPRYRKLTRRPDVAKAYYDLVERMASLLDKPEIVVRSKDNSPCPEVPILIIDPDEKPDSGRGYDVWQKEALRRAQEPLASSEGLHIIDGTTDAVSALKAYADQIDALLQEKMDLQMATS
jgi:hypothetical protein